MHAWFIFLACLAVFVAASLALVFLNEDREEREQVAREDRIHQAQAHLHTFRPRMDPPVHPLATPPHVSPVRDRVAGVAPRPGTSQAKGFKR